jgi:hypothetical protein
MYAGSFLYGVQVQALIWPVVLKDAKIYLEQHLFYDFSKFCVRQTVTWLQIFEKWPKNSNFYSFS